MQKAEISSHFKDNQSIIPIKSGLFFNRPIQRKLKINQPNDSYEREADFIADRVMRMPALDAKIAFFRPAPIAVSPIQRKCMKCEHADDLQQKEKSEEEGRVQFQPPKEVLIQRKCADCEEEDKKVQMKATSSPCVGESTQSLVHDAIASHGQPLQPAAKGFMESRFGCDFGNVEVHNDFLAHQSSAGINALAYTYGKHVVFGEGKYQPDTDPGKLLLAHELAHTIQQNGNTSIYRKGIDDEVPVIPDTGRKTLEHLDDPFPDELPEKKDFLKFNSQDTHMVDPGCPRSPATLGDVLPDPACPTEGPDRDGERFGFCKGSDILSPSETLSDVIRFARNQPAVSFFNILGYASQEGTPVQNSNLACHRAKRIARILLNAGVQSQRIAIFNRGSTNRFAAGRKESDLKKNRVAVVDVQNKPEPEAEGELPQDRKAIVEIALGKLYKGNYRLEADAYISYWTCGHVPSIIRAIQQTTVLIEGEDNAPSLHSRGGQDKKTWGIPVPKGLNTIILSTDLFDTSNPLECVISRIIDLAFHHAARTNIPEDNDVHLAGTYLAQLAGFGPCAQDEQAAGSADAKPGKTSARKVKQDPRKDMHPPCAPGVLPGPIGTGGKLAGKSIPKFIVDKFATNPNNGSAKVDFNTMRGIKQFKINAPRKAMAAEATVRAVGEAADIANYQVGFIQTVIRSVAVFNYVSGHQIMIMPPVPLLDAPPAQLASADRPWYYPPTVKTVNSKGVGTEMADAPTVPFFFNYLNIDNSILEPMSIKSKFPQQISIQQENPINRAKTDFIFHTWLVARHKDAPLDIFSTHFITGLAWRLNMEADFIGESATGTSNITISPLTDFSKMQMSDPVPNDINRFAEILSFWKPLVRSSAGGLSLREYTAEVKRIADPLQRKHGLANERILVKINIDYHSGRVKLIDSEGHISVSTPSSKKPNDAFVNDLFNHVKKDLVLAPITSSGEITTGSGERMTVISVWLFPLD